VPGIRDLLAFVPLYLALQRVLGAHRLRYRCIEELGLQPGDRVLDVGCGPAYYLERLPPGVRYVGFDTSARYVEYARRRFGGTGADFRCEAFSERHLADLPAVNAVMLLGLLHHLSDQDSRDLLGLARRALAPGGCVISVDTCVEPGQGRLSRWMSRNDRGGYVRTPDQFAALARHSFDVVEGRVVSGVTRIPSSFWMMRMHNPAGSAPPERGSGDRR
jgi:SAM-dependent methyltransferase